MTVGKLDFDLQVALNAVQRIYFDVTRHGVAPYIPVFLVFSRWGAAAAAIPL
jgi:hypothetical protein